MIVCFSFEKISWVLSLDVLGVFRVPENVFNLNFSTLVTKNVKTSTMEIPLNDVHNNNNNSDDDDDDDDDDDCTTSLLL